MMNSRMDLTPGSAPKSVRAELHLAQWTSPDGIGADELFWRPFSIAGVEPSTRRLAIDQP
jgi:hypothetical protein